MMSLLRVVPALAISVLISLPCAAQNVISAKSGTLHFFTGQVSIDGVDQYMRVGYFPALKAGNVLRTELGRAEVLLTPGVFLRLTDNTAIRMLDTDLANTRVEVMSGQAMVESDDPQISVRNAPVTLVVGQDEIKIVKHGLVGITVGSSEANEVKVYRGEAEVTSAAATMQLKQGRYAALSGDELKAQKFDAGNETNDLLAWSRLRSADLSAANLHSAGVMHGGAAYGYTGGPWSGGWFYDSIFSSYTFVPAGGLLWNPWGYGFYSPATIFGYEGISPVWFRNVYYAGNGNNGVQLGNPGTQTSSASRPIGRGTNIPAPPPGWTPRGAFNNAANSVAEFRHAPSPGVSGFRSGSISGYSGANAAGSGSFGRVAAPSFGGGAASMSSGGGGAAIGRSMGGGGGAAAPSRGSGR
jgi:hypothetical protein